MQISRLVFRPYPQKEQLLLQQPRLRIFRPARADNDPVAVSQGQKPVKLLQRRREDPGSVAFVQQLRQEGQRRVGMQMINRIII